jgi:hypothetical protein
MPSIEMASKAIENLQNFHQCQQYMKTAFQVLQANGMNEGGDTQD